MTVLVVWFVSSATGFLKFQAAAVLVSIQKIIVFIPTPLFWLTGETMFLVRIIYWICTCCWQNASCEQLESSEYNLTCELFSVAREIATVTLTAPVTSNATKDLVQNPFLAATAKENLGVITATKTQAILHLRLHRLLPGLSQTAEQFRFPICLVKGLCTKTIFNYQPVLRQESLPLGVQKFNMRMVKPRRKIFISFPMELPSFRAQKLTDGCTPVIPNRAPAA